MIRFVVLASLLIGCRISLEDDPGVSQCKVDMTSATCTGAVGHADLTWIQANIFTGNCGASSCHGAGGTPQAGLDLKDKATAYAHLVNTSSTLEPTRKLVVPNNVEASYLMLMLRDVPPAMADPPGNPPANGYMPKDQPALCCQKLEALERWIMAGAPNN